MLRTLCFGVEDDEGVEEEGVGEEVVSVVTFSDGASVGVGSVVSAVSASFTSASRLASS